MWPSKRRLVTAELPDDPAAGFAASEIGTLCSARQHDEARAALEEAKVRWPSCAVFWLFSGILWHDLGQPGQALSELAVALALAPDDPTILKQVGRILRRQGYDQTAHAVLDHGWSRYVEICGAKHVTEAERAAFYKAETQA